MSPARILERRGAADPEAEHLYLHVFYDSPVMQSASAIVCDQLRASFLADLQVHVVWSHFQHLADERYSREAAEVAAQADVVILATQCLDALPGAVARWLGSWICQQQRPDTALCGLFLVRPESGSRLPAVAGLLESTARLTNREWLAGCVRHRHELMLPPPRRTPQVPIPNDYFFAPLCHGING